MRPTPPGWPRISSALYYRDPATAIDWLCRSFGFEVRLKVVGDQGRIEHSELVFGDGLIMVGDEAKVPPGQSAYRRSPRSVGGGNTQSLLVYVDDAEAHCARARAAGARIVSEPRTEDYGDDYWSDRIYGAEDLEGHQWWFSQRLRNPA